MTIDTYDALVVGARCAGAATAMLMARQGLRVLVVDRAPPGSDVVSTHNLTRGAVIQLVRWGLGEELIARGTPLISRTTYHFGTEELPIDVKPVGPLSGLIAPRRPVLDTILAEAAAVAGADVRFGVSFRDVVRDGSGRVIGAILTGPEGQDVRVACRLLVGADGVRSTVARRVGARVTAEAKNMLGHIYGYFQRLPVEGNHSFLDRGLALGSAPTNDGADIVVASVKPERLQRMRRDMPLRAVLETLARETNPAFGDMLAEAHLAEPIRVFPGTRGRIHDCAGPGWALVGDAGYFRDPVTFHGVTDAFRDAELLAQAAILGGDGALATYQSRRDSIVSGIWALTDRIAAFDMGPSDLKLAFHALAQEMRREQDAMARHFTPVAHAA